MDVRWIMLAVMAAAVPLQAQAKREHVADAPAAESADVPKTECRPEQMEASSLIDGPGSNGTYNGINEFVWKCLGKKGWKDYKIADLAPALAATSSSGQIEVAPSYRWRRTSLINDVFRSSYVQVRGGIRAAVGSDTTAADLLDLTKFQFTKGLGGIASVEWGRSLSKPKIDVVKGIEGALKAAKTDCIAAMLPEGVPYEAALAKCSGTELANWMSDPTRNDKYFGTIIKPLWGYDALPIHYIGIEASYARPELSFFPLTDPAKTGAALLGALPAAFPDGASTVSVSKYYVSLYGGLARQVEKKVGWGVGASIAYRRDAAFPKKTENQTVCAPPSGTITRCFDINIAPPYQTEGFALSASLRLAFPRFGFLGDTGVDIKISYAEDIDQFAFVAPLYLFSGSDGAISGGIRGGCSNNGRTRTGYPISGECKAELFVGKKFSLK